MITTTSIDTGDELDVTTELKGTGRTLITEASSILADLTNSVRCNDPEYSSEVVLALTIDIAVNRIEEFDKEMFLYLLTKALCEDENGGRADEQ